MKKLTQFLVAAVLVAGGSAFAQTATQTVVTNVAGALSIDLSDTNGNSNVAALTTTLASTAAGNTASASITLNVNSSDPSGFNVTASTDDTGTAGHMCEWDATNTVYTTKCLATALSISSTSAIAAGTGSGPTTSVDLTTSRKIFSSSNTVSGGTITSSLSQPIGWTDEVLASNQYRMVITYTIASGV
jgi:hypothetical protein